PFLCLAAADSSLALHWVTLLVSFFFFFNAPATTAIYTLSLHDALPICGGDGARGSAGSVPKVTVCGVDGSKFVHSTVSPTRTTTDRKSTRLNSSHGSISYAVFCLKKKKRKEIRMLTINAICQDCSNPT